MRLSDSVVLPEALTVRQLHLLDSELSPWGKDGVQFTSAAHPTIIILDAAYKARVIDFDAADEMEPTEAHKLAGRLTDLAEQARAIPKV
jgi:hypothetical protein